MENKTEQKDVEKVEEKKTLKPQAKSNLMEELKIEKVVLSMGLGVDQEKITKGVKLLERITKAKPVKTKAKKRIASWNIRPGLPIGAKVTLRGKSAEVIIPRVLYARENILKPSNFDNNGNITFGIPEYIDIEGVEYDPEIKMMGLQVTVQLKKPGKRIALRRYKQKKLSKNQRVLKEESQEYMIKKFNIKIEK